MTKANKDGWIRWKGGKCPVEKGTLVDVRKRSGNIFTGLRALESIDAWHTQWNHNSCAKLQGEIMAYRLHKPEELRQTEADPCVVEAKQAPKFDPVALRDEAEAMRDAIRHCESCIGNHKARIAEIEKQLAEEGFALVEKPAEKQALPDMDDPKNWRVGDWFTCISDGWSSFDKGGKYQMIEIDRDGDPVLKGKYEGVPITLVSNFKFHSRP